MRDEDEGKGIKVNTWKGWRDKASEKPIWAITPYNTHTLSPRSNPIITSSWCKKEPKHSPKNSPKACKPLASSPTLLTYSLSSAKLGQTTTLHFFLVADLPNESNPKEPLEISARSFYLHLFLLLLHHYSTFFLHSLIARAPTSLAKVEAQPELGWLNLVVDQSTWSNRGSKSNRATTRAAEQQRGSSNSRMSSCRSSIAVGDIA